MFGHHRLCMQERKKLLKRIIFGSFSQMIAPNFREIGNLSEIFGLRKFRNGYRSLSKAYVYLIVFKFFFNYVPLCVFIMSCASSLI